MGKTLHNKIHLGRSSWLDSRRLQAALTLGVLTGIAVIWAALHGGWR